MDYKEITDLEVLELRKKVKELETKLIRYESLLKDNGLLDKLTQESDAEITCNAQIAKIRDLSDKGIPFTLEEVKILEILVKTLMMAKGKTIQEEKKKDGKKKAGPGEVAELLRIVGEKKPE